MKRTKVAIVTRTKNRKILLRRAFESVLGQTYQDWQLVIVNDGGGREHVEPLVEKYRDALAGRVVVLHHETSKGMEAASNAGIRASDSDYVVIHDDDDSWHPDFLAETVGYMEDDTLPRTNLGGVITHSLLIKEVIEGDRVIKKSEEPFNAWMKSVTLYRMAAQNSFPPISFLFKRSALDEVGYFREDLPVLGDWDFHLRFITRYDIGLIDKLLAYYHHRVSLMNGEYSNTVIGGNDKHMYYDAAIRNDILRKELASGKLGLGLLINISRSFEDLFNTMNHYSALVHQYSAMVSATVASSMPPTFFSYMKDRIYNLGKRAKLINGR